MKDSDLNSLMVRLRAGKVTAKESATLLPKVASLLQKRTKALRAYKAFCDGVADEDRLYVWAWQVWRRKAQVGLAPTWLRANTPDLPEVMIPVKPEKEEPNASVPTAPQEARAFICTK